MEYLRHIIQKDGVATDPVKVQAVNDWLAPKNVSELGSFLGLSGYYRKSIQGYGIICRSLFSALKKDSFVWEVEQEQAFKALKQKLTNAPVLALPDSKNPSSWKQLPVAIT